MSLKKLILDAYLKKEVDFKQENDHEIWVSHLSECQYKRKLDEERKGSGEFNYFPLIRGVLLHKGIQESLRNQVDEVEKKVSYSVSNYVVNGSVDVVLKDGSPVEIKTVHRLFMPVYPEHLFQLQVYMFMLKAERGYLVYVLDNDIKEVTVTKDGQVTVDDGTVLLPVLPMTHQLLKDAVRQYIHGQRIHPFNECRRCLYRNDCPYSLAKDFNPSNNNVIQG